MKKRLPWILLGLTAVGLVLTSLLAHGQLHELFPGFWALFGLAGGALLILVARGWGRLMQRPEDYYDDH